MTRRLVAACAVALTAAIAACGTGSSGDATTAARQASASSAASVTATPTVTTPTSSTSSPTSVRPTTKRPTPTPVRRSTVAAPAKRPSPTVSRVPAPPAQPAVPHPVNDPAYGAGANAVVTTISDASWARMVGYSWTSQCPVGRTGLRVVQVNFWGFDGKRSRGSVVVATSIALAVAGAFTSLYDQGFRIRQMRPMDSRWGHNPKGPGADDYAAMQADNTSAFNCRYVGGEEASKRWSRHSLGLAVDVNDFENPYVDSHGVVYPDSYFLQHRTGAGVFAGSSSAAVRAFTSRGLSWEGTVSPPDYQHFDG